MSKISFRADEDIEELLEEQDASKSEVIREALREYLEDGPEHEDIETDHLDDIHTYGMKGEIEKAEEIIEGYRSDGRDYEAFLLETTLDQYRE
ncbi:MAG: Arc/MetJ-type ribon-helix-helix transcriptional regulator [Candidatus Nanohaloarchaea archaeon]|jgi:Arc/MetJ-type ribon-helix-helix transcriptional regulator